LEPFWERPAGTQTHSRRTKGRLGRLRDTRQGLVRVSESNTKYGGKERKNRDDAAPVIGPSISESKRIRKQKKSCTRMWINLRPDVHREIFPSGVSIAQVRLTSTVDGILNSHVPWFRLPPAEKGQRGERIPGRLPCFMADTKARCGAIARARWQPLRSCRPHVAVNAVRLSAKPSAFC
jgi:hypothetical protein